MKYKYTDSFREEHDAETSDYFIIRLLDVFCERIDKDYTTPLMQLCCIILSLNFVLLSRFLSIHTWYVTALWWFSIPTFILRLDILYRFFRHRYLRKHHLPGPYGFGTIDPHDESWYYTFGNYK